VSPISARLLLLAGVSTVIAIAGLAFAWPRLRGWWRLARIPAVIVCQLLLVFTIGIAVNRTEDFYPSWAALRGATPPKITTSTRPTARLAAWLRAQQAHGLKAGVQFAWHAADDVAWGLRAPTVVYLPKAYFQTQDVDLPVVLLLTATPLAAPARAQLATAVAPGSAVVVVMAPDPHGASQRAMEAVPALLAEDVRVERGGWGIVATGATVSPALALFGSQPAEFGVLALLPAAHPTAALAREAQAVVAWRPLLISPGNQLMRALAWVAGELPPPLRPALVLSGTTTPTPLPSRPVAPLPSSSTAAEPSSTAARPTSL
jgi:hypothetical protein